MRFSLNALLLLLGLCWTMPVFAGTPALVIENPDFNFGEVLQGRAVEHIYTFRNAGDQTLVISRVRSSCGCTAALLSASEVPPSGSGEVRATFNSGRFRGPVEKSIYLYTNDPRQAAVVLRLRGTVRPELEAVPAEVNLGELVSGERREARVILTNRGDSVITLTAARATHPSLQVTMASQSLPPGKSTDLIIRAVPSGQETVNGYVIVRTDSPRMPELRIGVYGYAPSR